MKMFKVITYKPYNETYLGSVEVDEQMTSKITHNRDTHEEESKLIPNYVIVGRVSSGVTFRTETTVAARVAAEASMMEDKVLHELKKQAHPNPEGVHINALRERGYNVVS